MSANGPILKDVEKRKTFFFEDSMSSRAFTLYHQQLNATQQANSEDKM
jgi:hypothetical protein